VPPTAPKRTRQWVDLFPARNKSHHMIDFINVDYRMWLVRCRRLRASGVTASRRLHDRRGAEVIPFLLKM
jgi:hypothetical protein